MERSDGEKTRLEQKAGISVAGAMIVSGLVMLVVALSRATSYEPGGNVIPGLIIAALGLLANGLFWRRYSNLNREEYSSVIAAQQGLYRAKTSVDLCVVIALTMVAIAPAYPATRYVDILGSVAVAGYLLWTGTRMLKPFFYNTRELLSHRRDAAEKNNIPAS